MSFVDSQFHNSRAFLLAEKWPASRLREGLAAIERDGFANYAFGSKWWACMRSAVLLHASEQVRRWSAIEQIYKAGNRWDSVPEVVRESDLICEQPELLQSALWSECVFDELVGLGLQVGSEFELPPDWEYREGGVWFLVGGVRRRVIRDSDAGVDEIERAGRSQMRALAFMAQQRARFPHHGRGLAFVGAVTGGEDVDEGAAVGSAVGASPERGRA